MLSYYGHNRTSATYHKSGVPLYVNGPVLLRRCKVTASSVSLSKPQHPNETEFLNLLKLLSMLLPIMSLVLLKANLANFAAASQIAFNVESALMGSSMFNTGEFRRSIMRILKIWLLTLWTLDRKKVKDQHLSQTESYFAIKKLKTTRVFHVLNAVVDPEET